jgi:predicted N-formylglutamate amidohydrolase
MERYFAVERGGGNLPIVLSCDHAGREIPERYGTLGLSEEVLRTCSDVYDHGAAEIYADLRGRLDCDGVENRLCRLLIDVNRYRDQDTLIPTICGGREIPGNRDLDETERERRIERYYLPYQRAVVRLLTACERRHGRAFLFAVHTMAEDHFGEHREMDFCVACREGCPVAASLAERISGCGYTVTINSPFSLWRDVLRVPPGASEERFNAAAVLLETNERFCGRPEIVEVLEDGIREVLSRHADAPRGRL